MAISAKSKILASDVSGKVDTAGTGLTKSGTTLSLATVVTAGNAGPTANATPNFGATFTVPYITYDAYGRITGRTNRTVKIPAAPTSVSTTPNGKGVTLTNDKITAPTGGTWWCFVYYVIEDANGENSTYSSASASGSYSGGATISSALWMESFTSASSICIRTA